MFGIVHSPTGLLHLAASCLALMLGAAVMYFDKGTRRHKRLGYAYCVAMLVLNATAFNIYYLWGRFGIFHWFAVLSMFTLLSGMLPMFWMRDRQRALGLHLNFMYWSVIGLYCAFVSEIMVRIPHEVFRGNFALAINGSVFSLMALGGILFGIYRRRWQQRFGAR